MNTTAPATPPDPALADCDLLMKGGITSGVVYPKLIARLAGQYRFRCIGGTSAGAIAAAACAAAELRRQRHASAASFDDLARLPEELGAATGRPAKSMLFHLFQPVAAVRGHFAVLVGSLNAASPLAAFAGALRAMLLRFWPATLLAIAVALLLLAPAVHAFAALAWPASIGWAAVLLFGWLAVVVVAMRWFGIKGLLIGLVLAALATGWVAWRFAAVTPGDATWLALVCAVSVLLAAALAIALCGLRFVVTLLAGLHGNCYGLCRGRTEEPERGAAGLTDWLAPYLNRLAGLPPQGRPLTFGDLWGAPPDTAPIDFDAGDMPTRDRLVSLEVMTTALSQRTCFAIPFRDTSGSTFYYDRTEWAAFFPAEVMLWLDQVAAQPGADTESGGKLRRLPPNAALPVVVAVRMSLSFPLLLSAVPLYARDFSIPDNAPAAIPRVKRVWFSDGGISSNMPLHFFDAPLPGRPTFAVNLKDEHPAHPIDRNKKACAQDGRVYLPTDNRGNQQRYWAAPDDATPLGLIGFLWSIIDTMQNWRDEIQFPYPGYRDRIVQISQLKDEGGLNLDMPKPNIDALSDAGECAADRLAARFHSASTAPERGGWANHEEQRLRTFLALAEELACHPRIQDPHWDQVVDQIQASQTYNATRAGLARDTLATLRGLGQRATASGTSVVPMAPKPRPSLRIAPRI